MSQPNTTPDEPSDDERREILSEAKTIAVVGLSSKPDRPSYEVSEFLQQRGYQIVPINPNETEILGERAYPTLLDVPDDLAIDVVDVFRRPEHTPPIGSVATTASIQPPEGAIQGGGRQTASFLWVTITSS